MNEGTVLLVYLSTIFGAVFIVTFGYETVLRRYIQPTMRRDLTMAGATSPARLPEHLRSALRKRAWLPFLLCLTVALFVWSSDLPFPYNVVLFLSLTCPPGVALGLLLYMTLRALRRNRPLGGGVSLIASAIGAFLWIPPLLPFIPSGPYFEMDLNEFAEMMVLFAITFFIWMLLAISFPRTMYRRLAAAYEWREDAVAPR